MLAIVSSDKCYIDLLLEKLSYQREESPNNCEIYKSNYEDHEFIILVTGYGKVNIASNLMYVTKKYNIKAILSIGTCGSIIRSNDIFSCVIPLSTLQFDVDFIPNGYLPGQIPKVDKIEYKTNDDLFECLKRSASEYGCNYSNDIIATSDMFVNNYNLSNSIRREFNAGAVDTESGSIGEFSYINDIAYACIKVISNFSNNNSLKQYNSYDDSASQMCQKIAYKFIELFYEE